MPIDRIGLTLGITGPFGSGCSTLAKALEQLGHKRISISAGVREELLARRKSSSPLELPGKGDDRKALQDIGNEYRQKFSPAYWAELAVRQTEASDYKGKLTFDGIRNGSELEYLRQTFPNFFLISVWCPQSTRWERVKAQYAGDSAVFEDDDKRDGNEEVEYGQQVQLCVDKADIVIRNDENHTPPAAAISFLKRKIEQYLNLLMQKEVRHPHHDELSMAIAYTTSLRSLCLKRTVGAAITDHNNILISVGYNENPEPMEPCIRTYGYCYKDAKQRDHIELIIKRRPECPECKKRLNGIESLRDGFKCECGYGLAKAYSPDRGMSRCTAVHAEMAAILNAGGRDLRGKILYTTTFPCAQCARQIAYVGIKKVVYVDPYPDPDSERFLKDSCHITLQMFEGVKARAYDRVFAPVRQMNEKTYALPHK